MTTDPKATLNTIATRLRDTHKLLLEYEKRIYEKVHGRVDGPYQLLNLAMADPQFAWLRAMSGEMVHLDEVRLNRDGVTEQDLRLVGTRLRALLTQDRAATDFHMRYEEAKAEDPAILLAHRDLMQSLPEAPAVEIFISAGDEQDNKDPLPAAIRPGTLIPGFGNRGYYALGAIEERGLLANVPIKSVRYSNETVLEISSVPMKWTVDDQANTTQPWEPVVVQAGSGSTVSRTPLADGVSVSIYIRQKELGGEPAALLPAGEEETNWLRLATEEELANDILVYALLAAPNSEVEVPRREGQDTLIYIVAGTIDVDGVEIPDSRLALIRNPKELTFRTKSDAMVLAILVDPEAKLTSAGSVAR